MPIPSSPARPARWVVMGVSGCGKSEVGQRLAQALGVRFLEGDAYQRPDIERITNTVHYLHRHGIFTTVRNSAGQDVDGGCGQLRARAVNTQALHLA